MANQIKGEGTKSNLRDLAEYAKRNSYDQSESKAQSRRDLAPVEKFRAAASATKNERRGGAPDSSRPSNAYPKGENPSWVAIGAFGLLLGTKDTNSQRWLSGEPTAATNHSSSDTR